jgi:rubredoxin
MTWKCSVCNFIWEGDSPPEKCPKCGAPASSYNQLKEDEVRLIERSRFTNELHIELLDILPRLLEIAEEGIEDNLDPRCTALFQRLKSDATFLMASTKAELEGHMKKGKWG